MNLHCCVLVIIKASTPHARILQWEPERFDQVQLRTSIRAQSNHIAGIGRYLWLD
jgi:hypothetical protein